MIGRRDSFPLLPPEVDLRYDETTMAWRVWQQTSNGWQPTPFAYHTIGFAQRATLDRLRRAGYDAR